MLNMFPSGVGDGKGLLVRRLLRFGGATYGGVMLALVFVFSSCSDEQGGSNGNDAGPEVREVTRTVTVAEAPKEGKPTASEPERKVSAPPAEQALAESAAAEEDPPEDVLALQYRLINAGDYDGAYALFAEQSKALVSPEQYGTYFGINAPYSIADYSFPSVAVQGDAATVEAALTVNSASGSESYQRAQELVREGDRWRIVMRDEQASAFVAGAEEVAQYEPEPSPGPSEPEIEPETDLVPTPGEAEEPLGVVPETEEPAFEPLPESTTQYQGTTPSGGEDLYDCQDFDFQEDAQAAYDADQNDPHGLDGPPGESSTGVPGVACEELPSRDGGALGGATEPEQVGQYE